jgi:hypothetical protein
MKSDPFRLRRDTSTWIFSPYGAVDDSKREAMCAVKEAIL